jgi:predicted phosphodiesterase
MVPSSGRARRAATWHGPHLRGGHVAEPPNQPKGAIARDLTRVLGDPHILRRTLDLDAPHRFAILSDQHKGARDRADAFPQCEAAYTAAVTHYRDRGFTLVLLGDVEELWEQGFAEVARAYVNVLRLEASFGPDRYVRIFGNHDDDWQNPTRVTHHLAPFVPVAEAHEGLRLDVTQGAEAVGTMLLVHGHQGTLFSQRLRVVSRAVLRVWRRIQTALGVRVRTPATDPCLRGEHDRAMYEWAAAQPRLVLIAGHTHRPVWSSQTHLQKLEAELATLIAAGDDGTAEFQERVENLQLGSAKLALESPPCHDTPKTGPAYFNTGCCIYDDGDITGIELEDALLRLVKWTVRGPGSRVVFEEESLRSIFARLTTQ